MDYLINYLTFSLMILVLLGWSMAAKYGKRSGVLTPDPKEMF